MKIISEKEVRVQLEESAGPQGPAGPRGPKGEPGEQGPKGDPGKDGNNFVIRAMYASLEELMAVHPQGNVGDAYAVGISGDNTIYVWDGDAGSWKDLGALQGPKGDKGETGPAGPRGVPGEQGEKGDTGEAGPAGKDGQEGAQGPQGIQGERGEKGDKGDMGAEGPAGADGKTPVRGTDYWTASDIAEIKSYVEDAILGGAW